MKDTRPRFDGIRWWLLKRIVPKVDAVELLGYAAANAGYADLPDLTPDHFSVQATRALRGGEE